MADAPSYSKGDEVSLRAKAKYDPILRNALRYTISVDEYHCLHKYIISRSRVLKRNTPSVAKVERLVEPDKGAIDGEGGNIGGGDYNAAAVRASVRVFLATSAGLKTWELISKRLLGRQGVR
jgi:hypothetical protein